MGGQGKKTAEGVLAGQRLKQAYRITGTDRTQVADRTGIGYSALGNYEQGTRKMPIHVAKAIQKAIGVPAAYLMGLIDETDRDLLMLPAEVKASLLKIAARLARETDAPLPVTRPLPRSARSA